MLIKQIIMMNSIITPIMKHPMSMGMLLITQTILLCTEMSNLNSTSWYSYILFITMIGGLMIMFMYMVSITSNEKFKFMNKFSIIITMTIMITVLLMMNYNDTEFFMNMKENKLYFSENEEMKSTMKFFMSNKNKLTLIMMMILFLTLISVTNISSTFEGPLKKTYV